MAEITEASSSAMGSTVISNDDEVLSLPKTVRANWVLRINPHIIAQGQNNKF